MNDISKNLGHATAYGYAKSKGYTGTEEEFAVLMADYAAVGQRAEAAATAAAASATAASGSASDSAASATAAAGSAGTATTAAGNASQAAQTATTKASEAAQSATAAAGSATTASTKAGEAAQSATGAAASATTAESAKTAAQTAQTAAETAQTAAETAQGAAEDAAESVSASAAQIAQNTADISDIQNQIDVIYKSGSATATANQQTKFIKYDFVSGVTYKVTNKSTGYTTCNTKNQDLQSAEVVQSVGTIAPNSTVTFTANANAKYLSCYFGVVGTVEVIDAETVLAKAVKDISDINDDIGNIEDNVDGVDDKADASLLNLNIFEDTGRKSFILDNRSIFAIGYTYLSTGVFDSSIKYAVSTPNTFTCTADMAGQYTVGTGYDIALLDYVDGALSGYTVYNAGDTFALVNGNQYKIRVTEVPTDTSVVFTSVNDVAKSMYSYAPIIVKITRGKTYYVEKDGSGDFTSLVDAIRTVTEEIDATLYVGPGTWDIVSELGSTYMESVNSQKRGLYLKNRIHVICSSRALITAKYAGNNASTREWFSAFNAGAYGFTLENANIETDNIRYCVHDERGADPDAYENVYLNCTMKHTNGFYGQCIGGGLGLDGHIIVGGCKFITDLMSNVGLVSWHNSADGAWDDTASQNAQSFIDISGNYFGSKGSITMLNFGKSSKVTTALIHDNSLGSAISHTNGSRYYYDNIEVDAWNNEIRT